MKNPMSTPSHQLAPTTLWLQIEKFRQILVAHLTGRVGDAKNRRRSKSWGEFSPAQGPPNCTKMQLPLLNGFTFSHEICNVINEGVDLVVYTFNGFSLCLPLHFSCFPKWSFWKPLVLAVIIWRVKIRIMRTVSRVKIDQAVRLHLFTIA